MKRFWITPAKAFFLLTLLATTLVFSSPSQAGQGRAQLDAFFAGLKTLRAEFIQTLHDADMLIVEESEGLLQMQRPDRFRIDYHTPYEQTYVADGNKIWMYDKDLEQVTVRAQDATFANTPAQLLSGNEPVEKNYQVEELGFHEGFDWLELRPKQAEAPFDYIRLALEQDVIRAMEMVDSFGQMTRLYLRKISRNPAIDSGAFQFEPPPGVDVIGEGE